MEMSIFGKMLDLLKQMSPRTIRVANLHNPDNRSTEEFKREFERAATRLALEPINVSIEDVASLERNIAKLGRRADTALFLPPDLTLQALRTEVVALTAQHRTPAIYTDDIFVRIGGLASYSADRTDLYRRAASYIDRILRGEKAGDLPFQQPTKYQFKVNAKAARNLGLELSSTLLAAADEVIE
jgi:putative tryptophan/tyrosine transport system substrate-binding protein